MAAPSTRWGSREGGSYLRCAGPSSLGNGDGQRPNPDLLLTMLAVLSDAVALSLITASQRGTGVWIRRAAPAVS